MVHPSARDTLQAYHSKEEIIILLKTWEKKILKIGDNLVAQKLRSQGMVNIHCVKPKMNNVKLAYKRNPLEFVFTIILEYTSRCNMNCATCYNGPVERITETNIMALKRVVHDSIKMGVKVFAFIGGEVSKYGDGWLDLVRYMRSQGGVAIALVTNGWFCLEEGEFHAAGIKYGNMRHYLQELKDSGVTTILFSVDGDRQKHDENRGREGLYDAIAKGIDVAKEAGLMVRLSVLMESTDIIENHHLANLARKIYEIRGESDYKMVNYIFNDPSNILTNKIDIGNGACKNSGRFTTQNTIKILRCKGFFRPTNLTIKANGELATCRLANIGEGYGNIHQKGFIDVVNNMQNSFVFKLHADNKIGDYTKYVAPEVFGAQFAQVCAVRSVLTALAKEIGPAYNPRSKEYIKKAIQKAAKQTGHL